MAMISTSMTLTQRKQIAAQAARLINGITHHALIAGGYPRDIMLNAQPKDIDIFININAFPTQLEQDNVADRIFAAFGQTWTREHPVIHAGNGNPYADNGTGAFQVYYNLTSDRTWEPVNLIFSANNDRAFSFDWSVCEFYIQADGEFDYAAEALDLYNIQARDLTNLPQSIAHALRIKEKYPQCRFVMTPRQVRQYPERYIQLVEGGVFNNVPRETVPAQTQGVVGDEVRFNAGGAFGQALNRAGRRAQQFGAWTMPAPAPADTVWVDDPEVAQPINWAEVEERAIAQRRIAEEQRAGRARTDAAIAAFAALGRNTQRDGIHPTAAQQRFFFEGREINGFGIPDGQPVEADNNF